METEEQLLDAPKKAPVPHLDQYTFLAFRAGVVNEEGERVNAHPTAFKYLQDWIEHTIKTETGADVPLPFTFYHEWFTLRRMQQFLEEHGVDNIPKDMRAAWDMITSKLAKKYPEPAVDEVDTSLANVEVPAKEAPVVDEEVVVEESEPAKPEEPVVEGEDTKKGRKEV